MGQLKTLHWPAVTVEKNETKKQQLDVFFKENVMLTSEKSLLKVWISLLVVMKI